MKFIKSYILLLFSIFFIFACTSPEQKQANSKEKIYRCDVESINTSKKKFSETSGLNLFFQNTNTQSADFSHSGKYSSKLYPGNRYGLTTELNNVKPDDFIQITAWRKSKNEAGLIVADGGSDDLYDVGKNIIEEGDNGWQKISLDYQLTPNFYTGQVKIYVWNNTTDTVYFDDLEIIHKKQKSYPIYKTTHKLHLHVDKTNIQNFKQNRFRAYETGVLVNSDEDYAKLVMYDGTNFLNGKVRLKGDLVDHLEGRKWSFRIKLKNDFVWNRMRTFSVQNPSTRHFLYEWIAHKIYQQEDVLTTRYGLIPVELNGESLGVYAWEEHFEKQLIESNKRREGPIIRFDETIFWQMVLETRLTKQDWDIDYFGGSKIIPFKANQIVADSTKIKQLTEALKLLTQFKSKSAPVTQIFEIDKLARYYAVLDLTQAYHGFTWHNLRFYFNPVTCMLEPIAFDGYIQDGIYKRIDERVNGLLDPEKVSSLSKMDLILYQAFTDSVFNKKYINYLDKYSHPQFIKTTLSNYKTEADSLAELIKLEYPYFKSDFSFLNQQAEFIRNNLPQIRANVKKLGDAVNQINLTKFKKNYTNKVNKNLIPLQVHAFYNKQNKTIDVENFSNTPVKLLGVFISDGLPEPFQNNSELIAYKGLDIPRTSIEIDGNPTKLLFSIHNKMYETEISPWPAPQGISSRQKIINESNLDDLPLIGDTIIFDGNYIFEKNVVIPERIKVVINAGTKINFIKQAGFISFSAIIAKGTLQKPIEIISSDNSANGFNVIQAEGKSELEHVHFSGLGSLKKAGWQTPAATAFYESDVKMEFCTFASNKNCDDALNVVRSDFEVKNCRFENTFADAFDSDFCTGKVENCTFTNIGNDAIDFSGSKVSISASKMIKIADKAISGGEHSTLIVSNCQIDEANIGIAAKDLSKLTLDKIIMDNTVYGIVAFVKKPEYGPANITINNLKMQNNAVFHQIELGSSLTLNGKLIEGREKNLAVKLYQ